MVNAHTTRSGLSSLTRWWSWLLTASIVFYSNNALAQKVGEIFDQDSVTNRPLLLLTALAGLAIVPFALMMVTSLSLTTVALCDKTR